MAENKDTLALELRQIILADRMAADVIRDANETKKDIEAATEKEKAAILADAEKRRAEAEEQVLAEHEAALAKRKKQAEEQFSGQRKKLDEQFNAGREGWIQDIVGRITGAL